MHIHHFVGMGDFHTLRQIFDIVLFQHFQDRLTPANQGDLGAEVPGCVDGTQDRCFRRKVAAHGVENDLQMTHLFL